MRLRWMLGLIVLVLALALAACGGGDEEEENGGGGGTPAATKTVAAEKTQKPAETGEPEKTPEKTPEPSGGGGASFENIPVYPGAEKIGDWSSDYSLPFLGEDIDTEEYTDAAWAEYETDDPADDVIDFYKDKMPDNGWGEEHWLDASFLEDIGVGTYSRDDGDRAAWVYIAGSDEDKTVIVIGTGSK